MRGTGFAGREAQVTDGCRIVSEFVSNYLQGGGDSSRSYWGDDRSEVERQDGNWTPWHRGRLHIDLELRCV